jgi:hypothetical protein
MNAIVTTGIFAAQGLRRVRRAEVAQPAFDKPDPYALLMACWVDYMRCDDRDLGAGRMKLAGEGADERDVHEQQRAADIKLGESVNAMVDSLSVQYRWAIYKSQGISRGWRFQNADYEAVLMAARDELEEKLHKHVATRLYWA